ncbi:MAG TPA: glycosyltransferase family 39 protein, partial [Candidatus Omnitrophota bacterium]|nr:glycosyltransferase family 39 protein [Candidatus Omnitrophota bacterium]
MGINRQDLRVIVFLAIAVISLSLYANSSYIIKDPAYLVFLPPFGAAMDVNLNRQLGFEYRYIAEAIVAGKGFSNPFNADTGPTAWMPPVYPFLLAILIKVFGTVNYAAMIVVILKNVVLVLVGSVVYMVAKKTASAAKAYWAVAIYLIFLIGDFSWFFQVTHDDWLILLLLSITYIGSIFLWSGSVTVKKAALWGVTGGVGILSSPVLGYVWVVLTFMRALCSGGK